MATYRISMELTSPAGALFPHSRASFSRILVEMCIPFPSSLFGFAGLWVSWPRRHGNVLNVGNCDLPRSFPRRSGTLSFGHDRRMIRISIPCRDRQVCGFVLDLRGGRGLCGGLVSLLIVMRMRLSQLLMAIVYRTIGAC